MAIVARVETWEEGKWVRHLDMRGAPNVAVAESIGLIEARSLWRRGCAGVKVTVITEIKVLEKLR